MPDTSENITGKIDVRMAKLEGILEGVVATVEKVATAQERQQRLINDHIASSGRPQWSPLLSAAGLAAGAVVFIVVAYFSPLNKRVDDHEDLPGHTEAMIKHATTDQRLSRAFDSLSERESDIDAIDARVRTIESSRFDAARGDDLVERVTRLEARREADAAHARPRP